jgi:hypothetical protein
MRRRQYAITLFVKPTDKELLRLNTPLLTAISEANYSSFVYLTSIQQASFDSYQGDRLLRRYLLDLYRADWYRSQDPA